VSVLPSWLAPEIVGGDVFTGALSAAATAGNTAIVSTTANAGNQTDLRRRTAAPSSFCSLDGGTLKPTPRSRLRCENVFWRDLSVPGHAGFPEAPTPPVLWRDMAWSRLACRRWAQIPFGVPDAAPGLPQSPRLPRQRWRLKSSVVVTGIAVIGAADLLLWLWTAPRVIVALADELAHAATGLVAFGAFGVACEAPVVAAVLAGSVLIDLDHVPDLLGSDVLQHGIPRPYTHSLSTVVVLVCAALLLPSKTRKLVLVAALALLLHFFRDIAEPGGPGVALLWPFSDQAYTLEYGWYAGALVLLAAIALARRKAPSEYPRRVSHSARIEDRA
jgi:membrane-bound metal-dependent hydrolase YbcI (DUF457 family)